MKLGYIMLIILVLVVSMFGFSFSGQFVSNIQEPEQIQEFNDDIRSEIEPEKLNMEEIKSCPDSCDDSDTCTDDYCNEETEYKCFHMGIDSDVCICGEECYDNDPCTINFCDFDTGECINEPIEPCCGNNNCEQGESYNNCPEECEKPHEQSEPEEQDNEEENQNGSCSDILINELLPAPSSNGIEWVELYNPLDYDIDISGCYIDDIIDGGKSPKQLEGTIVPSNGFWVFETKSVFNNGGDDVNFIESDGITVIDSFTYESGEYDMSWYRSPNGGEWQLEPTENPTKGESN